MDGVFRSFAEPLGAAPAPTSEDGGQLIDAVPPDDARHHR
jgi:hypothetical protein